MLPSAADMQRRTSDLALRRIATMDHVLNLCVRHIIKTADVEYTECAYEIPEIVLGLPLYDIGTVVSYLRERLIDRGFRVAFVYPRVLIISWRKQSRILEPEHQGRVKCPSQGCQRDVEGKYRKICEDVQPGKESTELDPTVCRIGPPPPINTSTIRCIETQSTKQSTRPPFSTPYIKPIAELKPSGRFRLNLN